jgi:hypothetical protein
MTFRVKDVDSGAEAMAEKSCSVSACALCRSSSARWRMRNSPTWLPMAAMTFSSASSGALMCRPNSVITPAISPSARIGKARALPMPSVAAGEFRR